MTSVALSSAEAEILAASKAAKEAISLSKFLRDYRENELLATPPSQNQATAFFDARAEHQGFVLTQYPSGTVLSVHLGGLTFLHSELVPLSSQLTAARRCKRLADCASCAVMTLSVEMSVERLMRAGTRCGR